MPSLSRLDITATPLSSIGGYFEYGREVGAQQHTGCVTHTACWQHAHKMLTPTPPHPPVRRVASLVWTRRDHVPLCTDHACRCTLGPSPAPHLSPARRTATPTCTRRTTVYILQFCSSVRTTCGCAYRGHRALAYSNFQPQCGVTDVRRHSYRVTSGSFSTSDRIAAHVLLLSVRVYLKWWRLVSFTLACI